ncbi:L7Ae/L30e/S12e/Gadd45 family ribosomal protein [Pasteuria penetrans]|uniref:L7Ae/L30e/S12e/Gadd45 family ribosomal protein n=1 Tax=Pasteuria penetrans TaxID=86005 RepID=UPI001FEBEDE8|nr:L7Ae/L30e/S12e/Gadd45 family ribosomal protein [Pasteuria penetrans]
MRKSVTIVGVGDRLYQWIGLVRRAGQLVEGYDAVLRVLSSSGTRQQIYLVILAGDASRGNVQRLVSACERRGISWYSWGSKEALGKAVGGSPRSVIAITDSGFAVAIGKIMGPSTGS